MCCTSIVMILKDKSLGDELPKTCQNTTVRGTDDYDATLL